MKTKRGKIRVASFLTALILTLGIWAVTETAARQRYARIISASRQQALSDLGDYMSNIESTLTKGLYCSSPAMVSTMAASLLRESTGAKTSLSHLGSSEINLLGTYKFLSQVGDYTRSLSKKVSAGEVISDEEYENLKKLLSFAKKYSDQVDYMREMMLAGSFSFDEIDESLLDGTAGDIMNFSDASEDYENKIGDYPTLIYDGPFSDNVGDKESVFLADKDEISEDVALNKAAKFIGTDPEKLTRIGAEDSGVQSYLFSMGDISVAVTKKGGYVRYMLSGTFAEEEKISVKDAIVKGKEYLEKIGYTGMKDSYYSVSDGIATINYAYSYNGIICYTDLIKVGISLDNGKVVSFDATAYLIDHKQRSYKTDNINISKAESMLSKHLTVKSRRLAVIPTDNKDEVLTIEFLCKSEDNTDILVYINSQTLAEEEILILTYSDNGILTK